MVDLLKRFRGEAGLALGRTALAELAGQGAPVSPANYELWTAYLCGAFPELNREIEKHVSGGAALTDEVRDALFEKYFAKTRLSAEILAASAGIARELDEVVSGLRSAGKASGGYANELRNAATRLDDTSDAASFREIVRNLADATRKIAQHNLELEQQMQASSRHVAALQATLQEVRVEALTDGLTGLANRKHFDHFMAKRIAEADRDQGDLCLILCDIDHFKRVNDTWGHQVGDQVIRFVASVMQAQAKNDQLCARYGGEEFAILLPRVSLQHATQLAERIGAAVREKQLTRRSTGEVIGRITVSFGVAKYVQGEPGEEWVSRADACLYDSKRGGRDRVTTEATRTVERLRA